MSKISQEDWTRLNAYHDREMSRSERATFETRLKSEPDLHIALQRIKFVGATLKADPPTSQRTARTGRGWFPIQRHGARTLLPLAGAAAGIVLLLLGGFSSSTPEQKGESFAAQLAFFQTEHRAASAPAALTPTSHMGIGPIPDLTAAKLTLSFHEYLSPTSLAAAYEGRNGCKLMVFITPASQPGPSVVETVSLMRREWSVMGRHFTVLAANMDRSRFNSIAAFIRQGSERAATKSHRLAMRTATENAAPCA